MCGLVAVCAMNDARAWPLCVCAVCWAVNSLSGKISQFLLSVEKTKTVCRAFWFRLPVLLFIFIICTLHTALRLTLTHTLALQACMQTGWKTQHTHTRTHLGIVIVINSVTLQITSQISQMFGFLLFRFLYLAFLKFVDRTSFAHQIRFAGTAWHCKAAATQF